MYRSPVDTWNLVAAHIEVPGARVVLHGPPGTGKTRAAVRAAANSARVTIPLTQETPAAELRGHWIPGPNGTFLWHDGPVVFAARNGYLCVLNEIHRASDDTLSFLLAVLDDPESAVITLPTGETIRPHPNFRVIATMNGDPSDLPEALQDRLTVRIRVNAAHPNFRDGLLPKVAAILPSDMEGVSVRPYVALDRLLRANVAPDAAVHGIFAEGQAREILKAWELGVETAVAVSDEGDGEGDEEEEHDEDAY